ncbi:MAG: aspartate carbamoyltransferase regulatory subunit, partial [Succinivibrionaceae bacterium]|nr:aspartate carbamoyltransferase regulatory subunit [Succinivibrionaceae bacterium]
KDLIKIENKQLTQKQVNQLALLAPTATVNIIENFEVVQKYHPELPEKIEGVYKCPNNNCITNYEPAVVTSFFIVKGKNQNVKLKCKYCEKAFEKAIIGATLENAGR